MINTQLGRDRWPSVVAPSVIGPLDSRAELLRALDAFRRGVAGAPVVCKGSPGMPQIGESAPSVNGAGSHTRHYPADGIPSEGARLTVVASTDDADRHGDTVALDGWQLDNYRRNPVLLWAHDYGRPPIGRASELWRDGHALVARMEFAPTRFAQEVEGLYRQGYQRGVSVGFRPVRFEERRDLRSGVLLGIRFLEQELLEISAVPVPANGAALLQTNGSAHADPPSPAASLVSLLRTWRGAAS